MAVNTFSGRKRNAYEYRKNDVAFEAKRAKIDTVETQSLSVVSKSIPNVQYDYKYYQVFWTGFGGADQAGFMKAALVTDLWANQTMVRLLVDSVLVNPTVISQISLLNPLPVAVRPFQAFYAAVFVTDATPSDGVATVLSDGSMTVSPAASGFSIGANRGWYAFWLTYYVTDIEATLELV